jgi:hypothetical protein
MPFLFLKSEHDYLLTTTVPPVELAERFTKLTAIKSPWGQSMPLVFTGKKFIGQVNADGFFIIVSGRAGLLCNFTGQFSTQAGQTQVAIKTQLQKAFRRLYIIWVVSMAAVTLISGILRTYQGVAFSWLPQLNLLFMFVLARLALHGGYILARNRGMKEIERFLPLHYNINSNFSDSNKSSYCFIKAS